MRPEATLTCILDGRVLGIAAPGPLLTIGRHSSCSLAVVHDYNMSNKHVTINSYVTDTDETVVVLLDSSSNGTLLNDKNLVHKTSVILTDRDKIQMGSTVFLYRHFASQGWFNDAGTPTLQRDFKPITLAHRYRILPRSLGSGAFSVVQLAHDLVDKCQVACKIVRQKRHFAAVPSNEVNLLRSIYHTNIASILHYEVSNETGDAYMVLPLSLGSDLFTYFTTFERQKGMSNAESKFIVFQLLLALEYLHSKEIAHRDVKPENMLLVRREPFPKILLSDFGAAMHISEDKGRCGTLSYQPPEIFSSFTEMPYDDRKTDLWAAGCTAFLLCSGTHAFTTPDSSEDLYEICEDPDAVEQCFTATFPPQYFPDEKDQAIDVIADLLELDHTKRASASKALKWKWISSSRSELEALLCKKDTQR